MKAVVTMELKADNAESAQKIMEELCEELVRKETIASYRYEIETADGPVTEKCVLADGKVVA
jgi:phosphoribosylformylglycinamidine (FGAM) synthase PurS component